MKPSYDYQPDNSVRPEGWAADCFMHRLANVDSNVVIGRRTKIWQFASVIRHARVGSDCNIASAAIVDGSTIGDSCIVSHGAFIDPGIWIGNGVFIGPHVSLCNDAWPRVSKIGFDISKMIGGGFVTTVIEQGASLGANVVVLPGVVIGMGAMIAAGSVVTKNVPAMHLWKRDGTAVAIEDRMPERMRKART